MDVNATINASINASTAPPDMVSAALSSLSFSEFVTTIAPLVYFVIGLIIYTFFVFKFYRSIARKDLVKLDLKDGRAEMKSGKPTKLILINALENFILTPVAVIFWVAVITTMLMLLAENYTAGTLLITAVSTVAVIRVTSHFDESLAGDLAKLLPLTLLALLLFDASTFSIGNALTIAGQLPGLWKSLIYYLMFAIALEIVMRLIRTINNLVKTR
jgi:hypothetical protein